MAAVNSTQFDLITDDPRTESVVDEFRDWWKATKEMHGLLTQTQAARILGCSAGQVGVWVARGRLSSRVVGGLRMVGGGEVAALLRERKEKIRQASGRGIKAPSLSDMVSAAWDDMGMDDI